MDIIMTPKHPKWEEFTKRLAGPEGCDFQNGASGTTWKCAGDHTKATAILEKMGMDIDLSLVYFCKHGGYCDCEILFNV